MSTTQEVTYPEQGYGQGSFGQQELLVERRTAQNHVKFDITQGDGSATVNLTMVDLEGNQVLGVCPFTAWIGAAADPLTPSGDALTATSGFAIITDSTSKAVVGFTDENGQQAFTIDDTTLISADCVVNVAVGQRVFTSPTTILKTV